MTKTKKLNLLENRVSTLEKELNSLILALSTQGMPNNSKSSYEEVINEWLCGKKTN